jgi:hypothetical protein
LPFGRVAQGKVLVFSAWGVKSKRQEKGQAPLLLPENPKQENDLHRKGTLFSTPLGYKFRLSRQAAQLSFIP